MLYSIIPGKDGKLWLSGADGILRFDTESKRFTTGVPAGMLKHREFKRGASVSDNRTIGH